VTRSELEGPKVFSVVNAGASGSGDEFELAPAAWSGSDIDEAVARMERVCRMAKAGALGVVFDSNLQQPERELLRALQTWDEEAVSFSSEDGAQGRAAAGAKVSGFLNQVLERVRAVAQVETRVDGRLVASTRVGLAGDFASAVAEVTEQSELETHAESVEAELRMRRAWTRLVLSTLQMAVKLALATGTGNPLLVLPAAWKFMRGVLAERKQLERAA
jgi:hypothetical protein